MMLDNEFRILSKVKEFLFSLSSFLDNYPKKEKVVKDTILTTTIYLLENILKANHHGQNSLIYKDNALANIGVLDALMEYSYKNKYISEKQCIK